MREEAGSADVFAGLVHGYAIGLGDVGGDGAEEGGVAALDEVRGDDPFEAVAGGAPEEQHRLEVYVLQEFSEEFLNVR